jgi:hypothetical protein
VGTSPVLVFVVVPVHMAALSGTIGAVGGHGTGGLSWVFQSVVGIVLFLGWLVGWLVGVVLLVTFVTFVFMVRLATVGTQGVFVWFSCGF